MDKELEIVHVNLKVVLYGMKGLCAEDRRGLDEEVLDNIKKIESIFIPYLELAIEDFEKGDLRPILNLLEKSFRKETIKKGKEGGSILSVEVNVETGDVPKMSISEIIEVLRGRISRG